MGNSETKIAPAVAQPFAKDDDDFVLLPADSKAGTPVDKQAIKQEIISGINEVAIPPPSTDDQECWPSLQPEPTKAIDLALSAPRTVHNNYKTRGNKSHRKWKNFNRAIVQPLNNLGRYYGKRAKPVSIIQQPVRVR